MASASAEMVQKQFDYGALDEETRTTLQDLTVGIHTMVRRMANDSIKIGQHLLQAKAILNHGQFLDWLEAEWPMTERMARNFMSAAARFKSETVSDMKISSRVLFLISSPSTPDEVAEEVFEIARTGEKVTTKKVEELKDIYTSSGEASQEGEEVNDEPEASEEKGWFPEPEGEDLDDEKCALVQVVSAEILDEEETEELEVEEESLASLNSGDHRRVFLFLVGISHQYRSIFMNRLGGKEPFFDYDDQGLERVKTGVDNVRKFLDRIECEIEKIKEEGTGMIR